MRVLEKLLIAHDEYVEIGYPQNAVAVMRIADELTVLQAIVQRWGPVRWEARMEAIAAHARQHQTRQLAVTALSFGVMTENPLAVEFANLRNATPMAQQHDCMRNLTDSILRIEHSFGDLFATWGRVIGMRENIKIAIPLQMNEEVKRWLIAAVTPGTETIWTHDGRVLHQGW